MKYDLRNKEPNKRPLALSSSHDNVGMLITMHNNRTEQNGIEHYRTEHNRGILVLKYKQFNIIRTKTVHGKENKMSKKRKSSYIISNTKASENENLSILYSTFKIYT